MLDEVDEVEERSIKRSVSSIGTVTVLCRAALTGEDSMLERNNKYSFSIDFSTK